jgi:hypothetical protein
MLLLSCGGEARKAGEDCEDDNECPTGLECVIKACASGPVISYCSVECEINSDCVGFVEPSCTRISGLTKTCIEEGQNPCER